LPSGGIEDGRKHLTDSKINMVSILKSP
jgi:hypothetical protein